MRRLRDWWAARVTRREDPAWRLYRATAPAAVATEKLRLLGLEETPEGRFEALALELSALWLRLEAGGAEAQALRQPLAEAFVADMDASLRDLGAGDLGVGRRVQALTERLYGRLAGYRAAFADDADDATVLAALERNLYKEGAPEDAEAPTRAVAEVRRRKSAWASLQDDRLLAGEAPP